MATLIRLTRARQMMLIVKRAAGASDLDVDPDFPRVLPTAFPGACIEQDRPVFRAALGLLSSFDSRRRALMLAADGSGWRLRACLLFTKRGGLATQ